MIDFYGELTPTAHPTGAGPLELELTVWPTDRCQNLKDMHFRASTTGGLVYTGPESWTEDVTGASKDAPHSATFSVTIPPGATSSLTIRVRSEGCSENAIAAYFVVKEDTVEFHRGPPWSSTPKPRPRPLDEWTEEKLEKYIEVKLDLTEPRAYEAAQKALGHLLEGKGPGKHRVWITRRDLRDKVISNWIPVQIISPDDSGLQAPPPTTR